MFADVVYLSPNEIVAERPFTHPDHIHDHRDTLRYMLSQLCLLLASPYLPGKEKGRMRIVHFQQPETGNWFHRLVLAQPEKLAGDKPLTIVGFFGRRREDSDVQLAHEFDRLLISEIPDHPGLYSYSSMVLDGSNYGNLVIFADKDARDHWSTSKAHAQAVDSLAPNYYRTVSIYNGRLPNGVHDGDALCLIRAKYYDYQCTPKWQAVREISS